MDDLSWLKPISGYEGIYWITAAGKVINSRGVVLTSYDNGYGYLVVDLHNAGKRKHHRIHRLVADAFLPNPDNLPEVNHRDEDKKNNSVQNLEWCSRIYNNSYGCVNAKRSAALKQYRAMKKGVTA